MRPPSAARSQIEHAIAEIEMKYDAHRATWQYRFVDMASSKCGSPGSAITPSSTSWEDRDPGCGSRRMEITGL